MKICLIILAGLHLSAGAPADAAEGFSLPEDVLRDKLHGAWAGMLIGGLEGLPHEMKYNEQPREALPEFNLSITGGARTDDDNDFELTHLYYMDRLGAIKIPYSQIVGIWKTNINEGIWCANKEARQLMDKGVVPPQTADPARNSFASYNISAQFAVEMYGAIAPGMPAAAGDIAVHYAGIAVSGEPLEAARFWAALVSLAATHSGSVEELIRAALPFAEPASAIAGAVRHGMEAFHANPNDWKAARQALYDKWVVEEKWNNNATPSNGGMIILALLYGGDDFHKTLQYAMAMGLDADCNAATAGAVLGMRHGYKKLADQYNFNIGEVYVNTTRPGLPPRMKIAEQVELFTRVAERVILEQGGARTAIGGATAFTISPRNN